MPRGDFVVVTHPDKAPAADFLTRSTVGPFVDTGVDVTMRSQPGLPVQRERVYLSEATIRQLAVLVGVAGEASISKNREAQLIAQGKVEGLKEELGGNLARVAGDLGRILDALGDGRDSRGGTSAL